MPLIQPFAALRPKPEYTSEVIAPPYDVLNTTEARQFAKDKPKNFLHISKPEIDLATNVDPYDDSVYAKGAANFQQLQNQAILEQDPQPCYYVYRLTMGEHQQTGLAAAASIAAYQQNRIRKHEHTRPLKVEDRSKQIHALKAQTGPVMTVFRDDHKIQKLLQQATTKTPDLDATLNQVRHQIWVICDQNQIEQITQAFAAVSCLYIADGHHRSEAAAVVATRHKAANNAANQYFLTVIFPESELQILSYNRVIKDLNGHSVEDFLSLLQGAFTMQASEQPLQPKHKGQFGMYLQQHWYQLELKPELLAQKNTDNALDISLLTEYIIEPLLGITDPRRDPRIDFVGGIRGLQELEQRVDSGDMALAISLYPTAMAELISIADNQGVMPPKSTWFEPKLADGLLSYLI